jgi:HEPN domain-containing protein
LVDSKKFTEWIQMGKKDFRAAQILYEHEGDRGLVCFHCQQAVEKNAFKLLRK